MTPEEQYRKLKAIGEAHLPTALHGDQRAIDVLKEVTRQIEQISGLGGEAEAEEA